MNNNNLLPALILSMLILFGFQYLYVKPHQEALRAQSIAQQLQTSKQAADQQAVATGKAVDTAPRPREDIITATPRVPVETPQLQGSVNLQGARLDDIQLVRYRESVAANAPPVTLFSPAGSAQPVFPTYADISWLSDQSDVVLPGSTTIWQAEKGARLTPTTPLRLTWDNGRGLVFERDIAVDEHSLFTVTDTVRNNGKDAVHLYPYGAVARQGNPTARASSAIHEGGIGVLGGTLEEVKYKKLIEDGKKLFESDGGWLGITDKYWLMALIPAQDEKIDAEFAFSGEGVADPNQGHFQADFRGAGLTVAAGGSVQHAVRVFVGPKSLRQLDLYAEQNSIPHFDRAIDFGWFYFLTKPFLYLLTWLGNAIGHAGIAILIFTVVLKLVTLPLSLKSNRSMARMKELQPEIKRLQERYADDKIRQNQEMMELFKREKVSPMSGCVPTLIQIPIFFALYKVLYVSIELRQAPFFGWIHDMSVPDTSNLFTLFGLVPWDAPNFMHLGAWPIMMGCSMFLQQRLSPQPMDKSQAQMFTFMPIMFTFMLAGMPAGLVIYWTWSNLLSIAQQWYIMRHAGHNKKAA